MPFVIGAALVGVEGRAIEVEVRISSQLPRIDVVGLPEAAVRESAARVRAAIQASGHSFPNRRVTVNLAPAELRKQLALTKGQHLLWERVSDRELRVIILEAKQAVGAHAMRGFARRFRNRTRTTDEWMIELREGED